MVDAVGTTHSVKIGSDLHLVRAGTYRKSPAPVMGARFTTGDPDYNSLNVWQYWTQRCWVGGFGAETWVDDAMYDEAAGVDTTQHEVMALTRDMSISSTQSGWRELRKFIAFNGKLYCLAYGTSVSEPSKLWRLDDTDGSWDVVHTFTYPCREVAIFNNKLFIGDDGNSMTYMTTAEAFVNFNKPTAEFGKIPAAMLVYRSHLYVAFENHIWRLKSDLTWDGATQFYSAEGVNYITAMDVHLGFLYMASQDGHILRTDGNNTFDLWGFDAGTIIQDIRSFDGRLFITAVEPLAGTSAEQAVLYQLSGAAVTELKRWGKVGVFQAPGLMSVFGSNLWFGAASLMGMDNGFGIARYDPREDAYHIWATNRDGTTYAAGSENNNWVVDDIYYWKGSIYCSVRGHGIFKTPFSFRDLSRFQATFDTTASGTSPGAGNGGWITSSDFDAGTPGLLKYFDSIIIDVDLPHADTDVYVEVSLDAGVTWKTVGAVTKTGSGTRYHVEKSLEQSGTPLTGTHIKWRLHLRTENSTRSPQVHGVTIRYLPIPEPNWIWDFNIVLSERMEKLDGTEWTPDIDTYIANLELAFRAQVPVHFTDIDGTQWGSSGAKQVLIRNLVEEVRVVGPSSDGDIERDIRIQLLELKDSYVGVV